MTSFLEVHPGGEEVLLDASGKESELVFLSLCGFLGYVGFVCSGYLC